MLYFIRAGNYIKIGHTNDPLRRLRDHQTSNPHKLELLGVVKGGVEKEREVHEIFADFRVNGEWFELVTDILAYVAEHCKPVKREVAPRSNKQRVAQSTQGAEWIEFKPGTKRLDGSRLYYPKYRRRGEGGRKEWCGHVLEIPPLTEAQYRHYKKTGALP